MILIDPLGLSFMFSDLQCAGVVAHRHKTRGHPGHPKVLMPFLRDHNFINRIMKLRQLPLLSVSFAQLLPWRPASCPLH